MATESKIFFATPFAHGFALSSNYMYSSGLRSSKTSMSIKDGKNLGAWTPRSHVYVHWDCVPTDRVSLPLHCVPTDRVSLPLHFVITINVGDQYCDEHRHCIARESQPHDPIKTLFKKQQDATIRNKNGMKKTRAESATERWMDGWIGMSSTPPPNHDPTIF